MKFMKLAAGFAVGYVLGARAGRQQYERIAEQARRLSGSPQVEQAKQKVKDTANEKLDAVAEKAGTTRKPRPSRTKAAGDTPAAAGVLTEGTPSPAAATVGGNGTPGGSTLV